MRGRQQAKLTASDGTSGDTFGWAVAVSSDGSTALIGAIGDDTQNGDAAGSVYVFEPVDGSWTQQAKLTPDDSDSGDRFGKPIAISNDGSTALIGAIGDDTTHGEDAGSVYVFEATDETWTQQSKLTVDDGGSEDGFGGSVALSGDGSIAIVGAAWQDLDQYGINTGAAYVFQERDGAWRQQAKLIADDAGREEFFGRSAALSNDGSTALIGADNAAPAYSEPRSAYVFETADGEWSQQTTLSAVDGHSQEYFGGSVALAGNGRTALIGAPGEPGNYNTEHGAAYQFAKRNGSWSQQAKLTASDGDAEDQFGQSVSLSNDGSIALIGADGDDTPNGEDAGAAYVFVETDGDWREETKLVADDGNENDRFSDPVALSNDGTTGIIGAAGVEDPHGKRGGAAYVYSL